MMSTHRRTRNPGSSCSPRLLQSPVPPRLIQYPAWHANGYADATKHRTVWETFGRGPVETFKEGRSE